jgi:hypothetical protein
VADSDKHGCINDKFLAKSNIDIDSYSYVQIYVGRKFKAQLSKHNAIRNLGLHGEIFK